jgi:predicted glycoside hydrolase/deacetylase ChbG (UPF0249 family)
MNPALPSLGLNAGDRAVIIHADDVGMCHGANVAFVELSQHGLVSCGSVMAPCPWFREAAALAREHPELDLGVHLTLTSEWMHYRWGPLSTRDRASGLLDEQGYFWHRTPQVQAHLVPEAAEAEFRAQIETALEAGIDVTHLDAHMGVALLPGLAQVYARLGLEYQLPVLIPRMMDVYRLMMEQSPPDTAMVAALVDRLEAQGMPVADYFYISPGVPSSQCQAVYRDLFTSLPPGLTYFSLHPNAPGDIETINPARAFFRVDEYELFKDASFKDYIADRHIHVVGCRRLRDLMRRSLARSTGQARLL